MLPLFHFKAPSEGPQPSIYATSQHHHSHVSRAPFGPASETPSTVATPLHYEPPISVPRPPPPFTDPVGGEPSASPHDDPEHASLLNLDYQEEIEPLSGSSQAVPRRSFVQHNDADDIADLSAMPRLGNPFSGNFAISNNRSSRGRGGAGTPIPATGARGGGKSGLKKQAPQGNIDRDKPDEDYPAKRYSACKEGFMST